MWRIVVIPWLVALATARNPMCFVAAGGKGISASTTSVAKPSVSWSKDGVMKRLTAIREKIMNEPSSAVLIEGPVPPGEPTNRS